MTWGKAERQAIDDISAVGFEGIQFRNDAVREFQPAELRDLLQQHKLTFVALSSGCALNALATRTSSVPALLAGLVLIGVGMATSLLIRTAAGDLSRATHRAGTEPRTGGNIVKRFPIARQESISGVFARKCRNDLQSLRDLYRQIFHRVHGKIKAAGEESVLKFFRK